MPAPTTVPDPGPAPPQGVDDLVSALHNSDSEGVFLFDTGNGWIPSTVYTWLDMIEAVRVMAATGIGSAKLWTAEGNLPYALVNIAAFLAQCMQETIRYNACDENNWSDGQVVNEAGGSAYSAASACGQVHQSYQDYQCTSEEDQLAGGQMACAVDPNMEKRAITHAGWYGAPAQLFCAPKSKVPKAPRWNHAGPSWCGQSNDDPFVDPDESLDAYFAYVNGSGSCRDYAGQKAGGWTYSGQGCVNGACPGSDAPLFGRPEGRTDVEGCCWWGRGVIQTTGTCNFGKLNYYLGKRAADEGRDALYSTIDFCQSPEMICAPGGPPELKWVAGFFYWLNSVQPYEDVGWSYIDELKAWVDGGMSLANTGFIDGASGIVNRGCHNPPNCGTGDLHGGASRRQNFETVLRAMHLI